MTKASAGGTPWPASTVGAHFEIQLGKMLDSARNVGELKPYLGNRAVQWGRIDLAAARIVPLTKEDQVRYRLRKADLLVCEGGEVGRAAIWQEQLPECYYQKALHRLRPKSGFDPRVMMALLRDWAETGKFRNFVTQTSIAHLPRDKFLTMPLPEIPPREQDRIAEILEDAEKLGLSLERLIEKKVEVKRALMQQLLSGATRLPGFSGPWDSISLKNAVEYVRGVPLPHSELGANSGLGCLHYGDIHVSTSVFLDAARTPVPRAPDHLARGAGRLRVGDLVFVDASEDRAGVGKAVEITSLPREGLVAGLHTIAARFDKNVLADGFKAYLQFIPGFRASLLRLAAGTKVLATRRGDISSIEIPLPDPAEQKAIAAVLRHCDEEVDLLRVRLEKVRAIEGGVVRELLSGRTRLPAEEPAIA